FDQGRAHGRQAPAAGAVVEDGGEERGAVEPRPAQPIDGARPRDQRGRAAVADDGVVLDPRHRPHRLRRRDATAANAPTSTAAVKTCRGRLAQRLAVEGWASSSKGPCAPRSPGSGASTLSRLVGGSLSMVCEAQALRARYRSSSPGIRRCPTIALTAEQPIQRSRRGERAARTTSRAITSGW